MLGDDLNHFWNQLRIQKNQFWFLAVATFLVLNLVIRHTGGANAASRYALSMGMVTELSFSIDGYESITPDWSQTPDGHYYSNKPPGPSLFAFPVAWIVDRILVKQDGSAKELFDRRMNIWAVSLGLQAIFVQVIPCLFLAVLLDRVLRRWKVSKPARGVALIGLLFGTMASVLQNTMFGHGMAAWSLLAAMLFVFEGKLSLSGFFFGVALLADYGSALVLPGLIYLWIRADGKLFLKISQVALGALLPALLWVWYHTMCFGSPFVTSQKYLAPNWVDVPEEQNLLWGIFSLPHFDILLKLLFGPERGVLFTQPWILWVLAIGLAYGPRLLKSRLPTVSVGLAVASSFILLCILNASFNGWHGGETIGPRYMSSCFFLFPFWAALMYDEIPIWSRRVLMALLAVTVVFYAFAFPQDITMGVRSPWALLWEEFENRSVGMKIKVLFFFCVICGVSYQYLKKNRVEMRCDGLG